MGKVDFVKAFEVQISLNKEKEKMSITFLFMHQLKKCDTFWRRLEGIYCNKTIKMNRFTDLKVLEICEHFYLYDFHRSWMLFNNFFNYIANPIYNYL